MTSTRKLSQQVDWSTVLEIDLHVYNSSKDFRSRVKCLGSALRALFKQHPNIEKGQKYSSELLFFKSMKRADYDNLFETIVGCCPTPTKSIDIVRRKSKFIRVSPLKIIIKYLPTLLQLCDSISLKSLYITACAAQYLEVAERINKQYTYNTLVVFADMQPYDNLLAQLAKLSGRKTVTLQHGLYIDYSNLPNLNVVNYKNTVCEYFLAWGNSTKQMIEHYHPKTKVVICGKPIEQNVASVGSNKYLTVVFDQNMLKTYNADMLRIAYEIQDNYGFKINLRLHPRNIPRHYEIRQDTLLDKDIHASCLIIAHTTSMIHEVMRQGKAVYKYDTNIPSIEVPPEVLFSTAEDLMEKYYSSSLDHDFTNLATEYIKYIDKQSLEEYKKFFSIIARSRPHVEISHLPAKTY